jgi:hypothetical protein
VSPPPTGAYRVRAHKQRRKMPACWMKTDTDESQEA